MENKILSLIMTMCVTMIMIIVFPSTVNAAQSGSCGYNLTWTLDNGTLTISGSGSMTDYKSASTPWDKSRSSIKAVIIENGVTSIGDYAFFLCTALTSITTGDTVTSIGKCAFYGCTSLKLITVPIGVKNIGDSAFYDCSSLTSIAIPSSILDIGESTFRNCSSLFFVEIPDSVTSIGLSAFYNCTSLASILIPDSVISIEKETFYNTAWFNNQPDGLVYAGKVAYQYKGTMPDNTEIILRDDTKGIVSEAFYGCASLASITIPDSVTNIGRDAFYGCASLTSITIPDSVTSIGRDAFYGTEWFNNQPDGLVYAGKVAYQYKGTMSGNTKIILRDDTKSITESAFSCCYGLSSLTIPSSVTSIGKSAFYGCASLDTITIPNGVTRIEENVFGCCTSLTSVKIPDSLTSIGYNAFNCCISLALIKIPNSVTNIAEGAFSNCSSLVSVKIPDSVTSIGENTFRNCTSLISVKIPDSVTSIGTFAFRDCTSLTSITIPSSVMRIEGYVFYGCTNLSVVYYCGSEYEGSQIPLSFNDYLKDVKILYNYVMIPTLPTTQTKITKKSGYSIVNISVKDADEGSIILMSTYKNGALSDIQSEEYDGEDIMMATFEPYDTVKVMIWESLESMKPLSIPETVN